MSLYDIDEFPLGLRQLSNPSWNHEHLIKDAHGLAKGTEWGQTTRFTPGRMLWISKSLRIIKRLVETFETGRKEFFVSGILGILLVPLWEQFQAHLSRQAKDPPDSKLILSPGGPCPLFGLHILQPFRISPSPS